MAKYQNIHGRRQTRGVRPWLLIPKVLAVAVFFGALVAAAVIWFVLAYGSPRSAGLEHPAALLGVVRTLFVFVIVPALLASVLLGAFLFLQHPRAFYRLRWWRAKMLTLLIMVPVGHFYMAPRIAHLRAIVPAGAWDEAAQTQISGGFVLLLLGTVWLIWLGRHKPRLGQNWGKDFPR